MERSAIYQKAERLVQLHQTRDPFRLLDCVRAVTVRRSQYSRLKGFCALINKTYYVVINDTLPEDEQRIVAAHELGHLMLHKRELAVAPMKDEHMYLMKQPEEYEANLFAADLLMADEDVLDGIRTDHMDIFTLCGAFDVPPELMNFKMFSMISRGYSDLRLPMDLESRFLAKEKPL